MLDNSQVLHKIGKYKAICKCTQCLEKYECNIYDAKKSPIGHICKKCKNALVDLKEITQSTLTSILTYDKNTGLVKYVSDSASGLAGNIAGYKHSSGYLSISLRRKEYLLHRLIWIMVTGEVPNQIDHINHKRDDNRWVNLRNVTNLQNQMNMSLSKNSSSKVNGVRMLPSGKFNAYITVNRKQLNLGTYNTLEEAKLARKEADAKYGFHSNHGK